MIKTQQKFKNGQILHFCMEHSPLLQPFLCTPISIMLFRISLQGILEKLKIDQSQIYKKMNFFNLSIYAIYSILFFSAMVVCTILSAPMMFVSAQLLTITSINPKDYIYYLDNFLLDISVLALLATIFTTFVFLVSKNWRNMPHCQTLALIGSQG